MVTATSFNSILIHPTINHHAHWLGGLQTYSSSAVNILPESDTSKINSDPMYGLIHVRFTHHLHIVVKLYGHGSTNQTAPGGAIQNKATTLKCTM